MDYKRCCVCRCAVFGGKYLRSLLDDEYYCPPCKTRVDHLLTTPETDAREIVSQEIFGGVFICHICRAEIPGSRWYVPSGVCKDCAFLCAVFFG
jgi:hypothetical protein